METVVLVTNARSITSSQLSKSQVDWEMLPRQAVHGNEDGRPLASLRYVYKDGPPTRAETIYLPCSFRPKFRRPFSTLPFSVLMGLYQHLERTSSEGIQVPLRAVNCGSKSKTWEGRAGFVIDGRRGTTQGHSVGGKKQRERDVLFQEQIQNRVGVGLG